jgi:uncharacterized coiled-coil DUF342 family protein
MEVAELFSNISSLKEDYDKITKEVTNVQQSRNEMEEQFLMCASEVEEIQKIVENIQAKLSAKYVQHLDVLQSVEFLRKEVQKEGLKQGEKEKVFELS